MKQLVAAGVIAAFALTGDAVVHAQPATHVDPPVPPQYVIQSLAQSVSDLTSQLAVERARNLALEAEVKDLLGKLQHAKPQAPSTRR